MGNVTMPTPVAMAGGALCVLAGYLLGVVAGPDTPSRATAVVVSYDEAEGRLCLSGDSVEGQPGADEQGRLCGTWRRTEGTRAVPEPGDTFRFVSVPLEAEPEDSGGSDGAEGAGGTRPATVIYGDVVD